MLLLPVVSDGPVTSYYYQ